MSAACFRGTKGGKTRNQYSRSLKSHEITIDKLELVLLNLMAETSCISCASICLKTFISISNIVSIEKVSSK